MPAASKSSFFSGDSEQQQHSPQQTQHESSTQPTGTPTHSQYRLAQSISSV